MGVGTTFAPTHQVPEGEWEQSEQGAPEIDHVSGNTEQDF